ncbi:hypothetical protein ASPWEDRAFT_162755 [Aspergillus wentii DTO 134E9]|uniref:HEAT repeat protein n=1 Tax=Aspergillus wentii DTO 134E9 TaxID=1073089 RepID=A0A1L9R856_ASPWE|nr:uncharacterized protein ASPWEDRAFT_162755 [Aspergillus wentii DTO 134E9]OJJ31057.1 hypothetical protein ASPWEDRAFT_162755 [Aspergillus wentii DTO 134E9]
MENLRQESFKKLRAPCVELSSVGLAFRGNQSTSTDVVRALEPVYNILSELGDKEALDSKLAEYAFFPLSHIFNETQRVSARCLELAVNCLRVLVGKGWRKNLSPQMGKQLIILLTLIVGGAPSKINGNKPAKPESEELAIAGFNCLSTIFSALEGPVAEQTIFHEIGTATVVDQTVYILLEGIADERSDDLCLAAAKALQALYLRVTDRVVLASIMPRTVSALARVLKPTTQIRRSYRLFDICLQVLSRLLKTVLNDQVASVIPEKQSQPQKANDRLVLDESWLKATATQMKLALANIIKIRRHERSEVQVALLNLCLVVIEDCQTTLAESVPMMVETVVALSDFEDDQVPNNAFTTLKHLATTYLVVLDSLKDSLHTWTTSFPRAMQGNDETAKQWGIKQISTVFQVLSQVQSGSDILTTSLASGLCDSVATAVSRSDNAPQPLSSDLSNDLSLEVLGQGVELTSFPPVLLGHRSQHQTLQDLQSMIIRLNISESGSEITRSVINRVHNTSGDSIIAPFWLVLTFLKNTSQLISSFDDFISSDHVELSISSPTRASMVEELYYISLPALSEPVFDGSRDWRVLALALEAVALQAQQLGEAFRPELMDALYPVLQLLASNNPGLQKHAMTCLNILTSACNYPDTSTLIVDNVDYLVNSVALKLNTFDVSPYPPQVLFMMVKLCGARLIPYLDDLVGSIFGILDLYHGYPKLVEVIFKTLAAIVEEGTKKPASLAITDGQEKNLVDHRKRQYKSLRIPTLAEDFASRKAKRAKYAQEAEDMDERLAHPKQPWVTESQKDNVPDIEDLAGEGQSEEPLPPPREPEDGEKPLSKSHSLLLHIVNSIPSHLTSPSPHLRRSLLSILIQVLPVLAQNENSFLPLINDLWPSIISRIVFPSSFGSESSSKALMTSDASTTSDDRPTTGGGEFELKEEIYVITSACKTVEIMCQHAGDFMASRIESEFPRWERLYRRSWEKVRQDAEKAIERRAQQQRKTNSTSDNNLESSRNGFDMLLSLGLSQTMSLTTAGAASGARAFTPHHSLWRALGSLFITLLTHVRLPLSVGDQICEFLGAWIARFAGPGYYLVSHLQATRREAGTEEPPRDLENQQADIRPVEEAIRAMEAWNADLTWFIFQQQKTQVFGIMSKDKVGHASGMRVPHQDSKRWSFLGGRLMFAEMAF